MAESFRTCAPPNYKMSIKCIMAALKVPCSSQLSALCKFELGKLLWHYTRNDGLAMSYISNAYTHMCHLDQPLEQCRINAICVLAEIMISQRKYNDVIEIIRSEIVVAQKYTQFYTKLLLFLSEAYMRLNQYNISLEIVDTGIQFFRQFHPKMLFAECYFRLTKSLILSIEMTKQQELGKSVSELGEILQTVSNDDGPINDIRAFCYTIQLCYFLSTGMVKNSKQCLRQLHVTVQSAQSESSLSSTSWDSQDQLKLKWLRTELLSVLCNVQYSNFDRAHRYYSTAIKHFDSLRNMMRKSSWSIVRSQDEILIDRMEMVLYETIAQTQIIVANPQETLVQIAKMIDNTRRSLYLLRDFMPQIHTLLGFYSTYMKMPNEAEKQFLLALKKTVDPELSTMISLSLASIYLFEGREGDYYDIFEQISPSKLPTQALSLKAAAYFIQALHFFLCFRVDESRIQLLDSIEITKEEDTARPQSMSFLLLSKLHPNNHDALKTAYDWATKSCDVSLIFCAEILISQFNFSARQFQESDQMALKIESRKQCVEAARNVAFQSPFHEIIRWTGE